MVRTQANRIAVACADCPHCGSENVVARLSSARSGFNSTTEHEIPCKGCHKVFKLPENKLQIRRKPKDEVEAEYPKGLPWIE